MGSRLGNVPVVLGIGLGFGFASTMVLANSEDNGWGAGGQSMDRRETRGSDGAARLDSFSWADGSVERDSVANCVRMGVSVGRDSGSQKFRIFIGYDPLEDLAYEVCKHSILKRSSIPVEIVPIVQSELRKKRLYWRERGPTESTEFSFIRFLTPSRAGFDGWAMFVDCDFLYTTDIKELVDLIEDKYTVMCVHHVYVPPKRRRRCMEPSRRRTREKIGRPWFCTTAATQRTAS